MSLWQRFQQMIHYPLVKFGSTEVTVVTLFDFLAVIAIAFLIAALTTWLLRKKIFHFTKVDTGFQYMISKIAGYFVFLLGFFIGLQALGIDLTSFTVLAGALGVGIGFGLQNIINNFVSGIIILSERQLQVGDRIEVSGINGFIKHIGARSCILESSDKLLHIVPNSELISKSVTRWWGRDERYPCRVELKVDVGYEADLEEFKEILLTIAKANSHVLEDPAPFVIVEEFASSSIVMKLYVSSFDMVNKEASLKTELYLRVHEEFKKRGISIPNPQLNLAVKEPIKVEVAK